MFIGMAKYKESQAKRLEMEKKRKEALAEKKRLEEEDRKLKLATELNFQKLQKMKEKDKMISEEMQKKKVY